MPDYKRYKYLEKLIINEKLKNIIEIGVYRCKSSINMIKAALVNNAPENINYYGFDLFDNCPSHEFSKSHSAYSIKKAYSLLNPYKCNIKLIKGDTNKTIPEFIEGFNDEVDLIFLDGGHSSETIRNDWENIYKIMNNNTICIFDDYYKSKNTNQPGCNFIIDNLDRELFSVEILPECDCFEDKDIYFVKVQKKS